MSRTLERVPMDFKWPARKQWGGYTNPYSSQCIECPDCTGSGYSREAKRFKDEWYGNAVFDPVAYGAKPLAFDHPALRALAERNVGKTGAAFHERRRLHDFMKGMWSHHLIQADVDALIADDRLCDLRSGGRVPTVDEVNDWSLGGIAHDAINQWVCVRARCKREGVPDRCALCDEGVLWPTPEIKKQHDEWRPQGPPVGDGFQLWESVEYPLSPVFATMDELCEWCAVNATTFARYRATNEQWREMLEADFVCHREGNAIFL